MDFDRQIDRTAEPRESNWLTSDRVVFALLCAFSAAWVWLLMLGVTAVWDFLIS